MLAEASIVDDPFAGGIPAGLGLRSELSLRSLSYASSHGFLHDLTDGTIPSVLFGCDESGRHGNFYSKSYCSLCAIPAWSKRLEKVHTAYRRMRPRANWSWKELDCSNSSDALLMNIFCYPDLCDIPALRAMLGHEVSDLPVFGYKPRTPLTNGRRDNTEIDMKLGELLIEAKLTESDFQSANHHLISRYRDLETVFEVSQLPVRNGKHYGYQLIRGALAAYAGGGSFCVLCDKRRPDLIEVWYRIMCAVRLVDLRSRLKLLTWQELTQVLPIDLQDFLAIKYGIRAPVLR